mmetsp:Transcript_1197/g.2753  ORF Transcript_1197/g.2753 Transcript_1197/m.2753 type:complete len:215 (+) Transcript_1197:232-876(+)
MWGQTASASCKICDASTGGEMPQEESSVRFAARPYPHPRPHKEGPFATGVSRLGCPHSDHEPSYTAASGLPRTWSASASTLAVTPEPHMSASGCSSGTRASAKTSRSCSGGSRYPSRSSEANGTLRAFGMCPPRKPARGSGAVPSNLPVERASTTTAPPLSIFARIWSRVTRSSRFSVASKGDAAVAGAAGASVSTSAPSAIQPGMPPSSTDTR